MGVEGQSSGSDWTPSFQPQAPHAPPLFVFWNRQRVVPEKNSKVCTLPSPPSPLASVAPAADSSTRVDSPSHGLVTSSLCTPAAARLSHVPQCPPRPSTYKVRGGLLILFLDRPQPFGLNVAPATYTASFGISPLPLIL